MKFAVESLILDDILDLRLAVLRKGTPSRSASYSEDSDPHVRHLGVRMDGIVVACSTWIERPFPLDRELSAMQLKGMAVAEHLQGTGIGRDVLNAGIAHAMQLSCDVVWARARDTAIGFYERNGLSVVGDGFIDEATGMSHHLVVRRLNP